CQGERALSGPSSRHLTHFYLLLSVGGVLGGLFNGLLAPVLFHSLVEYPLVMALACLLVDGRRPARTWATRELTLDLAIAVAAGVAALILYSDLITVRIDTAFSTR